MRYKYITQWKIVGHKWASPLAATHPESPQQQQLLPDRLHNDTDEVHMCVFGVRRMFWVERHVGPTAAFSSEKISMDFWVVSAQSDLNCQQSRKQVVSAALQFT